MDESRDSRPISTVARGVALFLMGVVLLGALYLARNALVLIYISVLLAIGVGPVVDTIETQMALPIGHRRPPRWLAILAVYVALFGIITLVGLMIVPPLIEQSQQLRDRLPGLIERGQMFLIDHGVLGHRVTLEEAVRRAPGTPGDAVGTVANVVQWVFGAVLAVITILILTFYFLLESDSLYHGFARLFPRADRPRVEEASRKISGKVSAWLNGQLILAATIGITAAIGLYLLGVPYFYVLALVAAIGEMIPVVGPVLSSIPATIVGFTVSTHTGLFVMLFWLAQQQLENHLLVPKVMQRQVGISAVMVLVALLIGGAILGILGALLAVPTAAIIQVVLQEVLDERDRLDNHELRNPNPPVSV